MDIAERIMELRTQEQQLVTSISTLEQRLNRAAAALNSVRGGILELERLEQIVKVPEEEHGEEPLAAD